MNEEGERERETLLLLVFFRVDKDIRLTTAQLFRPAMAHEFRELKRANKDTFLVDGNGELQFMK